MFAVWALAGPVSFNAITRVVASVKSRVSKLNKDHRGWGWGKRSFMRAILSVQPSQSLIGNYISYYTKFA